MISNYYYMNNELISITLDYVIMAYKKEIKDGCKDKIKSLIETRHSPKIYDYVGPQYGAFVENVKAI